MTWAGFDIEIAKQIPEGDNWKEYRPLGITCAALVSMNGIKQVYWAGKHSGGYNPFMTRDEVVDIVTELITYASQGVNIVTWNGLQFDFDVLAEESRLYDNCVRLAMAHYDLMFQFFRKTGYPVGLDKVAKALGLPGKPEGMSGAVAPVLWPIDPDKVIEYVQSDALNTALVAEAIEREGEYRWTSRAGNNKTLKVDKFYTVRECLAYRDPDQSWLSNPIPPGTFTEWMKDFYDNGDL